MSPLHNRQILAEDLEHLIDCVIIGKKFDHKRAMEALIRLKTHPEVLAKRKEVATAEELQAIKEIANVFHSVPEENE